jgi:outer membrane protein assembly factor BamB
MPSPRVACLLLALLAVGAAARADDREDLWAAARKGDAAAVAALLDKGADVNAATDYGATALWFAASKERWDVVKLLVERKARVNVRDTVWGLTPLAMTLEGDKPETVRLLLRAGATGADSAAIATASRGQPDLLKAVLEAGRVKEQALSAALLVAAPDKPEVAELLRKAGAKPMTGAAGSALDALKTCEGDYESLSGMPVKATLKEGTLVLAATAAQPPYVLQPLGRGRFQAVGEEAVGAAFEEEADTVVRLVLTRDGLETTFVRAVKRKPSGPGAAARFEDRPPDRPIVARNWPAFRGEAGSGVADGQHPPARWDVGKGLNVLWKAPVPGLAHSSPVVWGDRVFVTTAVSADPKTEFKPGLYGAGSTAKDETKHAWRVYCLEKRSGKVLWERTAREGRPQVKRHIKSSHANPTPATDGKRLVVSFASEGLYCYDLDGELLWKQDLGVIDVGAFNDPDLQWGAASSPVICKDRVILQCDRHKDGFLSAYALADGKPLWRTARDEPPSWGTPLVYEGPKRDELVVNGSNFIRGYDPATGAELWRLGPNSKITTPAPVFGAGLIFVTNGYRPIQPIYAVRPGAEGDISLKGGEESNTHVAWAKVRGGPYMPTPLVYGGYLYCCSNAGVVTCYEARTGKQAYRERLEAANGFSASPVAADGKLYFTGEAGEVFVVRAGPKLELLATNAMEEACLATPAIADGMIFVRTRHHLYGLGWKAPKPEGDK